MKPKRTPFVVTYLLHFDRPVCGKSHYTGSTLAHRLRTRLQEHSQGAGSRLTSAAAKAGVGFTCARVWLTSSREHERRVKDTGHFKRICPMCQGRSLQIDVEGQGAHFEASVPVFSRIALDFE